MNKGNNKECILCKNQNLISFFKIDKMNFIKGINKLEIYRCEECGLTQIAPMPELKQLRTIYEDESSFTKTIKNPNQGKLFFNALESFYERYGSDDHFIVKNCLKLTKKIEKKNILDIGCNTGNLLRVFKNYEPDSELLGIDIDPNSKTKAFPEVKDCIRIGEFLDTKFNNNFDIITMKTIVEHLPNLIDYLKKSISLLNPGGVLFISTPDIGSKSAQIKKESWEMINDSNKKLGHILWLDKKSAKNLAKLIDVKILLMKNRGPVFYHLPKKIQNMIIKIFDVNFDGRPIKNYQLRIILATIFDGILAEKFSYGDVLYLFMTKNNY